MSELAELWLVRTEMDRFGQGVFGHLIGPQDFRVSTGELPWLGNARDVSCIPCGRYRCTREFSFKHKYDVYWLHDVPGREDVQIHRGNWCGDVAKGWKSDVQGCVVVGLKLGVLPTKLAGREPFDQRGVISSETALNRLFAAAGREFWLNVVSGIPGEKFQVGSRGEMPAAEKV